MEQQNRPYFEREPDHVNEIGTKFWSIEDFDDILETIPLDITIMFSEYIDEEGEDFYGYIIIENDTVLFETPRKSDIMDILNTVKEECIERGYIEGEEE